MVQHKAGMVTKNKIYAAAEKLFYENGFINTKVTDIIDLSGTNKGCFYHYYENKAALGYELFLNTISEHARIAARSASNDELVTFAVELAIFWYAYFQDEKIRRFSSELNAENIIYDNEDVYRLCLNNTVKEFSHKEISLIRVMNVSLYRQLTVYMFDKTKTYTFEEARNFYLKMLFEAFEIPISRIDYVLGASLDIFRMYVISLKGFHIKASFKK